MTNRPPAMLQLIMMGSANIALGLPKTSRQRSVVLVTNSEGDDITVKFFTRTETDDSGASCS